MLTHFQIQSLYEDQRLPGWLFSFYFQQAKHQGIYLPNGTIKWSTKQIEPEQIGQIEKQIHDLMIFHIYDRQR
ncbi:DUF5342 family protein [Bacillus sp. FJAT-50079]|uniref:DUF5342 family protein n=1 Tax=Bacillus sp. FJAT-50079 TaxID=2833577 RepID=UPI001BC8D3AE|nr:DUF5342 family protein [Bacillus sp. FJAT-50079]MBS4210713.1 DUF5342 family protein [Bacillus sp. FJAT-50079]